MRSKPRSNNRNPRQATNTKSLRFECQSGCTKCCDRQGFVYLTEEDSERIAAYLGLSTETFEEQYVYRTAHIRRLRIPRCKTGAVPLVSLLAGVCRGSGRMARSRGLVPGNWQRPADPDHRCVERVGQNAYCLSWLLSEAFLLKSVRWSAPQSLWAS